MRRADDEVIYTQNRGGWRKWGSPRWGVQMGEVRRGSTSPTRRLSSEKSRLWCGGQALLRGCCGIPRDTPGKFNAEVLTPSERGNSVEMFRS